MSTKVLVGDRVRFELPDDQPAMPGRYWQVFLDDVEVNRGLVDFYVGAPVDDLTIRSAIFDARREPSADLITELRRNGWSVIVETPIEGSGLRAVVLDEAGEEVSYRVPATAEAAAEARGRQAAQAAFWYGSGDTRRQQAKAKD